HDRVLRVRQIERTARVFDGRAEKPGRELVFHLLYSAAVGVLEEESDHPVLEHAIDKNPYDLAQLRLPAQFLEKRLAHRKASECQNTRGRRRIQFNSEGNRFRSFNGPT